MNDNPPKFLREALIEKYAEDVTTFSNFIKGKPLSSLMPHGYACEVCSAEAPDYCICEKRDE